MVTGSHRGWRRHGPAPQQSGASPEKLGAATATSTRDTTTPSQGEESDGVDPSHNASGLHHSAEGICHRFCVCIHAGRREAVCARSSGRRGHSTARKVGLADVSLHTLRHTFISRLVQAGRPLNEVAALAGHRDIKMTLRYAHLAPDHLREGIAALEPYGNPPERVSIANRVTLVSRSKGGNRVSAGGPNGI